MLKIKKSKDYQTVLLIIYNQLWNLEERFNCCQSCFCKGMANFFIDRRLGQFFNMLQEGLRFAHEIGSGEDSVWHFLRLHCNGISDLVKHENYDETCIHVSG